MERLESLRAQKEALTGAANKKARQKLTKQIKLLEAEMTGTATESPDSVDEPAPEPEQLNAQEAKKREQNRKKRERAKAKKRASAQDTRKAALLCRAERRDAGDGRGKGMFVLESVAAGEPVVRARPVLSVVFDHAATRVCGLCFATVGVQPCTQCKRFAACCACSSALAENGWHKHECQAFVKLPAAAKRGETATLRMLIRHRAVQEHGDWCGTSPHAYGKESLELMQTLQGDTTALPPQQLMQLSRLTGVELATVRDLIYRIRTNAASLDRGGKAGCALSVYMGYTNHSCRPNAQATIDGDGFVCLCAVQQIDAGSEMTISYVDTNCTYDERRKILLEHYGFTCRCARCRSELKNKLRAKGR